MALVAGDSEILQPVGVPKFCTCGLRVPNWSLKMTFFQGHVGLAFLKSRWVEARCNFLCVLLLALEL